MACITPLLPAGLLDLADLERRRWPEVDERIRLSGHPTNEGDDEDAEKDDVEKDSEKDKETEKDDVDKDRVNRDDDWQTKSRKNETRAKRAERENAELKQRLEKIENQSKSEQEKAIEQARKEARDEALTEAEKERRADRLEVAVTRLASRGVTITVKDGDGEKDELVKFADPEDALDKIERSIRRGELDTDDIYDAEGKVNNDALTGALADLASASPHLLLNGSGAERRIPKGDADTRKGEPAKSDLEAMSPEDHAKRKYGAAK